MDQRFAAGDLVQTPFGKGTVREVRNNGRVVVDVAGHAMVLNEVDVAPADRRRRRSPGHRAPSHEPSTHAEPRRASGLPSEVDLHGLTVNEALERAGRALNDALLGDLHELRFVHGKSGGRIRAALHGWLHGVSSVRSFRIDPRNEGVTIVTL